MFRTYIQTHTPLKWVKYVDIDTNVYVSISNKARPYLKSVRDVIHTKCINKTNFMSGIDVYMYDWPHSNII